MNCRFIELKTFSSSIFKITFSLGWGFSIKQRKTCEANSAPLFVPTPTCRLPYLAWRDSKTWYPANFADNRLKVLLTTIGRSPPSGFFSAISFAPKKYGRSSKGTFPLRITFTGFVKALRNFSQVFPFDLAVKSFKIWGELPSNPALEPLGKDIKPCGRKTPRLKNNRYLWGPEQSNVPFADVSAWGRRSCRSWNLQSCRRLLLFWFRP